MMVRLSSVSETYPTDMMMMVMDIVCDTRAMCQALISCNPCSSPVRVVYDSPPDTAIHSMNFLSSYDWQAGSCGDMTESPKDKTPVLMGLMSL